ncbi:MAG: 5-amino-6-(D-ribitylamino)uracil--L-tyrosine 4-hydroxyphenyl transferase CofH [Burkholderiales bacterium]
MNDAMPSFMMGRYGLTAVVPVKLFSRTKQRLAPLLAGEERAALSRAMLEDVLAALTRSPSLAGILVVTGDPAAAVVAQAAGAIVIDDTENAGTTAAVLAAAGHLERTGQNGMLVIPADVPLITPADIEAILAAHRAAPSVTLVPANHDGGTNAIACSPPQALAFAFGEASFQRHRDAARACGLFPATLNLERVGNDIDRPDDIARLLQHPPTTRTHAYLAGIGMSRRLARGAASSAPGCRLSRAEALALMNDDDLDALMRAAAELRDATHGAIVTYSRKVFIPLTHLCRDVCHYCTFARPPRGTQAPYLTIEQVLAIARAGAAAGCKEALFTLGDKPELRYRAAREALSRLGHGTTLSYLAEAARAVLDETGLLPHMNPGVYGAPEIAALRKVSVSQGIMLESAAERLCEKGGPHHGSPDKRPAARLETIRLAGEAGVPITTGLLIGIGETRAERIDALLKLRDLNDQYGHIQEIIIQNFRPKPGTRMARAPAPSLEEHLWTIAVARLIFDPAMNIQAPPNLSPDALSQLVDAGINDWGGVSPVTPDHVNPEAPWPHLDVLAQATAHAGKELVERLAIYPAYVREMDRWVDAGLRTHLLHRIDSDGFPRTDSWSPGMQDRPPVADAGSTVAPRTAAPRGEFETILARARRGDTLREGEIVQLFRARGRDFTAVCAAADELRKDVNGDTVTYVVNRNINYTNICSYRCQFCAFAKGRATENLRGKPYDLPLEEIQRRAREAWQRGATEVCMQGGIHPTYTGATYLEICRAVKAVVPEMHVHAFSPLEIWQGARTLGLSLEEFFAELKRAGLGTLPGTAAEILDDEVRSTLCPDKVKTGEWLEVVRTAHRMGFRTTSTIMFGHMEGLQHWARHLLRLRTLQAETGGFTEFVPLPFVHMEAPIYRKGRARRGPTFREAVLMHAVARLTLYPLIPNIQASWVKMGPDGVRSCLRAGANDLGGTLMNESISRAAGASHGQEMTPAMMEELIHSVGRTPRERTTLYASSTRSPQKPCQL